MPSMTVPTMPGMDFGVGVDTASGEARNVAATGDPSTIPGAGGSIVSFSMMQVSTVEDLMSSLNISAAGSGGFGLFSASARMDFAKSCKVHSSSVFLFVSVKVREAFASIKAPGITDAAAQLFADGQEERFQGQFGDMFVRGLLNGGEFTGVIEVSTKDETDHEAVSLGLSASYAAFSAEGTFDSKFSQTVSTHSTKVQCHIEGGLDSPVPTQVDSMTDRAVNFPGTVKNNAVSYVALLNSYDILPLPTAPTFADLQHQKDVLLECAQLRNGDLQLLNEVHYIAEHQDEFPDATSFPLAELRDDVTSDLEVITDAASHALEHPKTAAFPTGLKLPVPPELPKRVGGRRLVLIDVPDLMGFGMQGLLVDAEFAELRSNFDLRIDQSLTQGSHGGGMICAQTPAATAVTGA